MSSTETMPGAESRSSETSTDDGWSDRRDTFATKHEKAKGKAGKLYHLALRIGDPGAKYEEEVFARLPERVRTRDFYELPLASDNQPFDTKARPDKAYPTVVAFFPMCHRFPKDRDNAANYTFVPPGSWIYIYLDGNLWDEVYVMWGPSGGLQLCHVNLTVYQGLDRRHPTTVPQSVLVVPVTDANGKPLRVEMAVSHVQWSWAQICHYGHLAAKDPRRTEKNKGGAPLQKRRARNKRLQRIQFAPFLERLRSGGAPLSTPRTGPGEHLVSIHVVAEQLKREKDNDLRTAMWSVLQEVGKGKIGVVLHDPIHVATTLKKEHNDAVDAFVDIQHKMARGEHALAALIEGILDTETEPANAARKAREEAEQRYRKAKADHEQATAHLKATSDAYHQIGAPTDQDDERRDQALFDALKAGDREHDAERDLHGTPGPKTPLKDRVETDRIPKVLDGWADVEAAADEKMKGKASLVVPWLRDTSTPISFEDAMSDFFEGNLETRHAAGIGHWLFLLTEMGLDRADLTYFQEIMAADHPIGGALGETWPAIGKLLLDLAFEDAGTPASGESPLDVTDGFTWVFRDDLLHAADKRGNPKATAAGIAHGAAQVVAQALEAMMKSKLPGEQTSDLLQKVVKLLEKVGTLAELKPGVTWVTADSAHRLRRKVKGFTLESAKNPYWKGRTVPRITFEKNKARVEAPELELGGMGKGIGWIAGALELISMALTVEELTSSKDLGWDAARLVNSLGSSASSIVALLGNKALREQAVEALKETAKGLEGQVASAGSKKKASPFRGKLGSVAELERRLSARAAALSAFKVLGIATAGVDVVFSVRTAIRASKRLGTADKVAAGMEVGAAVVGVIAVLTSSGVLTVVGIAVAVGALLVRHWFGESEMEKYLGYGYFGKARYVDGDPFKKPEETLFDRDRGLYDVDLSAEINAFLELFFNFVATASVTANPPVLTVIVELSNFLPGESELEVYAYPRVQDGIFFTKRGASVPAAVTLPVLDGERVARVTYTFANGGGSPWEVEARLRIRDEAFVPADRSMRKVPVSLPVYMYTGL